MLLSGETIDWHQTTDEEFRILRFLRSRNEVVWHNSTIEDLARSINHFVPVVLHSNELDLLGVDPAAKIAGHSPKGSVAAQLFATLAALELTFEIRHGCLLITSLDYAETAPMVRCYPLAASRPGKSHDFDSLVFQLQAHIKPDSWLQSGGTSGMTVFERKDQWLLNVSAPLQTQLRVSAFLQHLLPLKTVDRPVEQRVHRNPHPSLFDIGYAPARPNTGGFFQVEDDASPETAARRLAVPRASKLAISRAEIARRHLQLFKLNQP